MVKTSTISLSTRGNADVHDITEELERVVASAGFKDGAAIVFCSSSTSAVATIEYEAGAVHDLRRVFDEIVPGDREYDHNARWGDGNGHSHIRASLLGASLTVPVVNGRLALGTWQQVIHVDFDNRPRRRELTVQMIGE
jgi:secondary thiamine-phosphate synthase enzyme